MSKENSTRTNKRIRAGDRVVVIAGNDKGRTGTILSRKGDRLVIEGINVRTKHVKKTNEGPGRIAKLEMPINASNVMLCPKDERGVRTRLRQDQDGDRFVVYKSEDGQEIVHRQYSGEKKV